MAKITGLKADDLEELLKGEDGEPLSNAPGIVADKVGERITEIKNAEFNKAKSKTAKALESIVKSAGIEDFEDATIKIENDPISKVQIHSGDDPSVLKYGNFYGRVTLNASDSLWFGYTNGQLLLPKN